MSRARRTLAAVIAITGMSIAAIAYAQTPIDKLNLAEGVSISGVVTEVFGNRFVVEDPSGKILVETGPEEQRIAVTKGEKLTVIGRPNRGSFEAFTIVRANGEKIAVRQPPEWRADFPPKKGPGFFKGPKGKQGPAEVSSADSKSYQEIVAILEKGGYTKVQELDRKRRHYEFSANNRFGERVEVHIDFGGNIYKEERIF